MGDDARDGTPAADLDKAGQDAIEGRTGTPDRGSGADVAPAGPHATPGLTNPDATPGAGSLPSRSEGDDVDAGTG